MSAVIDIGAYSYAIGGVPILDSVTFQVRGGEYCSIIGPNGAGKSTLLKCLMRINRGGRGRLWVNGGDIGSLSQRNLARLISYVPQEDAADVPVSVQDYVMMSRYPHLSPFTTVRDSDRAAVGDALDITGCSHLAGRMLTTLSGGERRTVAIAAALAQGSGIMLLDEPTTFLDPRHELDVLMLIRRINRDHGVTILSVTHNINHAAAYSDRVAILQRGECVFHDTPQALMTNEVLAPVYGRSFTFMPHPETGFPVIIPEGYAL